MISGESWLHTTRRPTASEILTSDLPCRSRSCGKHPGQASGSRRLAGVNESPDVDRTLALQVEQQIGELVDRHDPEVRHRELVRESERSEARVSADSLCCGFDCVDEPNGRCGVRFGDVVATGWFEIDRRKISKLNRLRRQQFILPT